MLGLRRHVFPHTIITPVELGMFGIATNGKRYLYDDLKAKIESGRISKNEIVAIGFNNEELNAADRGDGTTGCGFCIGLSSVVSKSWAEEKVAFNPNKLPYITTKSVALTTQMSGKHNTELIKEISDAGECGTYTYNSSSKTYDASTDLHIVNPPAVNYCLSRSLTIGGVKRIGFLPSFAQLYYLNLNYTTLQAFLLYSARQHPQCLLEAFGRLLKRLLLIQCSLATEVTSLPEPRRTAAAFSCATTCNSDFIAFR